MPGAGGGGGAGVGWGVRLILKEKIKSEDDNIIRILCVSLIGPVFFLIQQEIFVSY